MFSYSEVYWSIKAAWAWLKVRACPTKYDHQPPSVPEPDALSNQFLKWLIEDRKPYTEWTSLYATDPPSSNYRKAFSSRSLCVELEKQRERCISQRCAS